MDRASKIKELLKEIIAANPNLPMVATVIAIHTESCTVQLADGLELSDVKLKATITGQQDHLLITPLVGSDVVVMSLTGDLNNLSVIKVNEVESIEYRQNGLTFLIDSKDQKVSIKNESTDLLEVFTDLTRLLKEFKVYTANGPSGTPLPNTTEAIMNLETKFNNLLK